MIWLAEPQPSYPGASLRVINEPEVPTSETADGEHYFSSPTKPSRIFLPHINDL